MKNNLKDLYGKFRFKALLVVISLIILVFIAEKIFYARQLSILKKEIIIIQGETPDESNFLQEHGEISKNTKFFGDRSLQLSTPVKQKYGYYAEYRFEIPKEGDYNIVIAGTPPGPRSEGSPWHSPYKVAIDNDPAIELFEETIRDQWPSIDDFGYVDGGYFLVKLLSAHLTEGIHKITFIIDKPRTEDGNYTFYIDAVIISPLGYRPFISNKKLPKELFQAL